MKPRFRLRVRDLIWIVALVALLMAFVVDRRRHESEVNSLKNQARETIHGLSREVWQLGPRSIPPWEFSPETPLPREYDWKEGGSLVPEWAEEVRGRRWAVPAAVPLKAKG